MGLGSATEIRRAGIVVVVQRPGLGASFDRAQIASSEIHGMDASLYRGRSDYKVPAGERFYVFSIEVGEETINFGLLSARGFPGPKGPARVWAIVTFYLPKDVIANADKDAAFHAIDPWFVPEGRSAGSTASGIPTAPAPAPVAAPAAQPAAPVAVAPAPAVEPPARPAANLTPGMTRDQVVAAMGKPQREVTLQGKTWLTYPGMIVVLEGGKLISVNQTGETSASAKVAVQSNPAGGDIYIDGQMVGQTPSTFELPAGEHQVNVQLAGYLDWVRHVHLLTGSEINLTAKLEKK